MEEFTRHFKRIIPSIRAESMAVVSRQRKRGESLILELENRQIEVWLHRAAKAGAPVVFELHGGGLVLGDAAQDDNLRQCFCELAGCHVVGVNYRKAPEDPYPAGLDDVCDALRWFARRAGAYGMDKNRFVLMGFSGGANLTAAAAVRLKDEKDFTVAAQLLHYPYLDAITPVREKPVFNTALAPELMTVFTELYSAESERRLPAVSPVCASVEELSGCAPAAVFPVDEDSLREDGLRYGALLARAGVPVYMRLITGVHHGYIEDHCNRELFESAPEDRRALLNPEFGRIAGEVMRETAAVLKTLIS